MHWSQDLSIVSCAPLPSFSEALLAFPSRSLTVDLLSLTPDRHNVRLNANTFDQQSSCASTIIISVHFYYVQVTLSFGETPGSCPTESAPSSSAARCSPTSSFLLVAWLLRETELPTSRQRPRLLYQNYDQALIPIP
ncbi:hypothetical protein BJX70DRAFT_16737 [Aspergillus crustosus]